MKQTIMNFFDGDISKSDITNALSRLTVLVFSILVAVFLVSTFQDTTTVIDKQMNPLVQIVQDESLSESTKAIAMNKLTELSTERESNTFWQAILQTCIMLFVFTLTAGIIAFAYSKINWTAYQKDSSFKLVSEVIVVKILSIIVIFATVFLSGSIIYLAQIQ